ncbi:MAG: hypothetical protein BJ554DRAFT_57 [Olpidium bornovanus]|uniref:Uncharacterized protein n=1 Tax=Olpidium bornovanus TaxID=278681 RepID=A0A8H8DIJ1_9FUNG|nr:MAG: hypothetical protein BJ554DRAFT_57 [Olpidium bornovanus]
MVSADFDRSHASRVVGNDLVGSRRAETTIGLIDGARQYEEFEASRLPKWESDSELLKRLEILAQRRQRVVEAAQQEAEQALAEERLKEMAIQKEIRKYVRFLKQAENVSRRQAEQNAKAKRPAESESDLYAQALALFGPEFVKGMSGFKPKPETAKGQMEEISPPKNCQGADGGDFSSEERTEAAAKDSEKDQVPCVRLGESNFDLMRPPPVAVAGCGAVPQPVTANVKAAGESSDVGTAPKQSEQDEDVSVFIAPDGSVPNSSVKGHVNQWLKKHAEFKVTDLSINVGGLHKHKSVEQKEDTERKKRSEMYKAKLAKMLEAMPKEHKPAEEAPEEEKPAAEEEPKKEAPKTLRLPAARNAPVHVPAARGPATKALEKQTDLPAPEAEVELLPQVVRKLLEYDWMPTECVRS